MPETAACGIELLADGSVVSSAVFYLMFVSCHSIACAGVKAGVNLACRLQVNEAQLQFGGTAAGSRYSFKPAALRAAPSTSAGAIGIQAGTNR